MAHVAFIVAIFNHHRPNHPELARIERGNNLPIFGTDRTGPRNTYAGSSAARYGRPDGNTSASAALMKHLRKIVTERKKTIHSLRHRKADQLRAAECPEEIRKALLGHSKTPRFPLLIRSSAKSPHASPERSPDKRQSDRIDVRSRSPACSTAVTSLSVMTA